MGSAKTTGQQETNAALAVLAATGNAFALGQLWEINKGLLHSMFWKWYSGHREQADAHGMTVDDFEQEGFFAVQYATEHYDPGKGIAFSTWLAYAMKRQIYQALTNGHRRNITGTGGKIHTISADPLNHCTSLDAPADMDGESDTTFGELLPDQTAAREMQGVEDRLYHEQMHDAVESALQKLVPEEADVIRQRFYLDKTRQETASAVGKDLSAVRAIEEHALRNLRADQKLRRWHDDFITIRAWSNAGFFAWQNSGSIQERTIREYESWMPDMVRGLAAGIRANEPELESAADSMAGKVSGKIKRGIASAAQWAGFASGINISDPLSSVVSRPSMTGGLDAAGFFPHDSARMEELRRSIAITPTTTKPGGSVIEVPVSIDGREVARATAWYMGEELAWEER